MVKPRPWAGQDPHLAPEDMKAPASLLIGYGTLSESPSSLSLQSLSGMRVLFHGSACIQGHWEMMRGRCTQAGRRGIYPLIWRQSGLPLRDRERARRKPGPPLQWKALQQSGPSRLGRTGAIKGQGCKQQRGHRSPGRKPADSI